MDSSSIILFTPSITWKTERGRKHISNDNGWKWRSLNLLFDRNTILFISKLRIPIVKIQDKIIWISNKTRKFSIQSTYSMMVKEVQDIGQIQFWRKIWKARLHEHHKLFLWKIA